MYINKLLRLLSVVYTRFTVSVPFYQLPLERDTNQKIVSFSFFLTKKKQVLSVNFYIAITV